MMHWRRDSKMPVLVQPRISNCDAIKFNGRQINKNSHSHNYSRKSKNAIVSLRLSLLYKWNRKSTSCKFTHVKFVNAFSNRGFLGRPHIHTLNIIGAAGTFSNLGLSILLTFSASFVRHVNVKINKGEPENTLQVRS